MCGLAGTIIVKKEINADDFIRSSFVANSLRGMDASGMGVVYTATGNTDLHKLPINGSLFITDRVAEKLIRGASDPGVITMCHTRHATAGKLDRNSAHPFECFSADDTQMILGAHNGTLNNWKTKKGGGLYDVDSEWALNHILTEQMDAFEDFHGAYCFTWWDSNTPEVMNIARNKERPMHVVMLKSGGMAYASEAGMLYWLLERHSVAMDGPVMELEADMWYKFPVDNPANFSKLALPTPVSTYVRPVYSNFLSVVDKVKQLIDDTKAAVTANPPASIGPLPRSRTVTEAEYESAKDLNLLGTRVYFTPYSVWHGSVEGTTYMHDMNMSAEVRDAGHINFAYDDTWQCTVIGVMDDGKEIILVLGPPAASDIIKGGLHATV